MKYSGEGEGGKSLTADSLGVPCPEAYSKRLRTKKLELKRPESTECGGRSDPRDTYMNMLGARGHPSIPLHIYKLDRERIKHVKLGSKH